VLTSTDFRFVPLGDLDLLNEISKQPVIECHPIHHRWTGAVIRHVTVVGTQRMYRARIFGRQDPMTVVVSDDPEFERVSQHLHKIIQLLA
jgi:hypothetical protein